MKICVLNGFPEMYTAPRRTPWGKMLVMCVLGEMVRNPKISAKMGNKMNEGMAAPYKKVLAAAKPKEGFDK